MHPPPADDASALPAAAVRHRRPSLRLRLTLWMVVIALVIQLTLGLVVFLYQASALNTVFDDRIRERAEPLVKALEQSTVRIIHAGILPLADQWLSSPSNEPRFVALFDQLGVPVAASPQAAVPPDILPLVFTGSTRHGITFRRTVAGVNGASTPWRIVAQRLIDREGASYFLVVGRTDHAFEQMLALIRRVLILSLPVGIIGAGVAGWLISGLAVAPVRRIRQMADSLAPETIEQPVHLDVGLAEFQDVQAVLEEMRDRIRNAFVARDKFIANISHELKTPIAVILTEAQTLDARGLNQEARTFVRSVIDETRRLSRTIESFLTLTKIRAGKSLMEHTPCSVSDFVMDAVLGCSRMARQQQVTINPLLAEGDQPRQIVGDCELLRVMIDNLLRNAIRFSPPDSQVVVHVTESPTECTISVRDDGPAVPSGPLKATPDPASTNGSTANGRPLTLGLSIAQTIAELHAGNIAARNFPDGGCEFVVRLPADPVSPITPPLAEHALPRAAEPPAR